MTFDPIAVYHQLMLADGKQDFPVVPNTLDNALKDEKSCIVVTTARVSWSGVGWVGLKGGGYVG